ncbi:MAG: MoxR-like ATPase [Verrucomicrobiales bacterium]|jgi:MoxR-like ATPase
MSDLYPQSPSPEFNPAPTPPPAQVPEPAPVPVPVAPPIPVPAPVQVAPAVPVAQPAAAPVQAAAPSPYAGHPYAETAAMLGRIREQVSRVFIGQDEVVNQLLASLIAGGHVLLEGKPGLGKTHLVLALANAFGGEFGRIQFTPDLMPSDVTGHTLYDMGQQVFRVRKGPVFVNLLLGDEINRAPAKTQAALLEVMQELQVTIDGESHKVEAPFMTIATQNPIEQEGTYPLPEAQLDRFLIKTLIDYPEAESEKWIVQAVASGASGSGLKPSAIEQVCSVQEILKAQHDVAAVRAVEEVVSYAVNIVRATRTAQGISLGAGTRGAIGLVRLAKAYAVLDGRDFIAPHDVKTAVLPVLRHRIALSPELLISGQHVDQVLTSIVQTIEAPRQ